MTATPPAGATGPYDGVTRSANLYLLVEGRPEPGAIDAACSVARLPAARESLITLLAGHALMERRRHGAELERMRRDDEAAGLADAWRPYEPAELSIWVVASDVLHAPLPLDKRQAFLQALVSDFEIQPQLRLMADVVQSAPGAIADLVNHLATREDLCPLVPPSSSPIHQGPSEERSPGPPSTRDPQDGDSALAGPSIHVAPHPDRSARPADAGRHALRTRDGAASRETHLLLPPDARILAGAAFARWWLGLPADRVDLPKGAEHGVVAGPAIKLPADAAHGPDFDPRLGVVRVEQALLAAAAGMACGPWVAGLPARLAVDVPAGVVPDWFPFSFDEAWMLASRRAIALTGGGRARRAISEMAALLSVKRWLDVDVNDVCGLNFGGTRPRYDVWRDLWPPDSGQLFEAEIPSRVIAWPHPAQ